MDLLADEPIVKKKKLGFVDLLASMPIEPVPIPKIIGQEKPQSMLEKYISESDTLQDVKTGAGLGEVGAAMATHIPAKVYSGLKQLWKTPFVGAEKAAESGQEAEERYSYQPRTKSAEDIGRLFSYPFEKLSEYGEKRADIDFEKTGSAVSAAAIKTLYDFAPYVAGARGGIRAAKARKAILKQKKGKLVVEKERVIPDFKSSEEAVAFGIEATPSEVKALKGLWKKKDKQARAISTADAMKNKALDKKKTDITQQAALYKEAIEFAEGRKLPKDMAEKIDPVIKQRKWTNADGIPMQAPKVRKGELKNLKNAKELRDKPLEGWLETSNRIFDEIGSKIKEQFYWPIKDAEYTVALERMVKKQSLRRLRKGISNKSSKRIGTHAIAEQQDGMVRLNKMGIFERPKLTPKETAVYDSLRTEFESLYKRLNIARMKSGKDPFPKTKDYFTFMQDMSILDKLGFNPVFTSAKALTNQFMHMKTTPFRFAKMRGKQGVRKLELDAFDIYDKYSDSAIQHIHMSPVIAKGREMLLTFGSKKGGNRWILKEHKPRTNKFLTEWLDFQAGQKPPTVLPRLIENGLLKLNQNLTFAILGANVRSALIQPSAILNTFTMFGPKYTYKGITSLLSPKKRRFAMDTSKHLPTRDYDVAVSDAFRSIRSGRIGKMKKTIGGASLKPLQILDMETAKATFHTAYEYGVKEVGYKRGSRQAQRFADDWTMKTQASAAPSDIARIQRSPVGKTISLFQTFVINEWGFLTRDVLGMKNAKVTNPQAFKRVLSYVVGATAVNSFYEDVLGVNSPHPTPIRAFQEALERGESVPSATIAVGKELIEKVPIIGGGLRYGKGITGAGSEAVRDLITEKKIRIETVSKLAGVPGTAQVAKTIRARKRGESTYGQIVGQYTKKKKKKKRLKGL